MASYLGLHCLPITLIVGVQKTWYNNNNNNNDNNNNKTNKTNNNIVIQISYFAFDIFQKVDFRGALLREIN